MSNCSICNTVIQDGEITTQLSCCSNTFHAKCFVFDIYVQRYNSCLKCKCEEVLVENGYHLNSMYETSGLTEEIQNSQGFKKDVKALKEYKKKNSITLKAYTNKLRELHDEFKQQTEVHVSALRLAKNAVVDAIKSSEEYKAYVTNLRGYKMKRTHFIKKYNDRTYIYSNFRLYRFWRYDPSCMINRKFGIRV